MCKCSTCWLSQRINQLSWFEFYLSNKKFFVYLNQVFLVPRILSCSAQHGSILDLIFLLNVKMIFLKHCQNWFFMLTALVFLKNKDFDKIEAALYEGFSSHSYRLAEDEFSIRFFSSVFGMSSINLNFRIN